MVFFFVALFLMVFWAGQGFGQDGKYDVASLPDALQDPAFVKKVESAKKQMVTRRNADTSSEAWNYMKGYYTGYIFKKMTQPDARGELASIVEELLKDVERSQKVNATSASELVGWLKTGAGEVAAGNYHPTARINATLLLGQLDDKPADNSTGTPPTPSAAALAPLYALWNDAANPDGVRAAALRGLRRWVAYGFQRIPSRAKPLIQNAMFELAAAAPPAGRDPAAHGFLQRYALDILYVLNDQDSAEKLTNTLIQLSSDPDAEPIISLYAAQKLARLGAELQPIAQPTELAVAWSFNASHFFTEQSDYLTSLDRPAPVPDQPRLTDPSKERMNQMAGGAGGYGSGEYAMGAEGSGMGGSYAAGGAMGGEYGGSGEMGYGMGGMAEYGMMPGGAGRAANPQPIEVVAVRRKLNHALQSWRMGLTGSPTAEPPKNPAGALQAAAEPENLQKLADAITEAVATINDPQYDTREAFAEMLVEQAETLEKLNRRLGGDVDIPAGPGSDPGPLGPDGPPGPDVALAP